MFYFSTTPLLRASSSGNLDQVKELLSNGADVNAADDSNQRTALHVAGKSMLKHFLEENFWLHTRADR